MLRLRPLTLTLTLTVLLIAAKADDVASQLPNSVDAASAADLQKTDASVLPDITLACDDCIEWQVYRGQQSTFGRQLRKGLTLTQCQRACLLTADCVGFDYDRSSSPCWLHLAMAEFSESSTYRVTIEQIDQYRLVRRCRKAPVADSLCERIFATCVDGSSFYKAACLAQASAVSSNFNRYLNDGFYQKCRATCQGEDEGCLEICDKIKSKGQKVSGQLQEQAVAQCNAGFDEREAECRRDFMACI